MPGVPQHSCYVFVFPNHYFIAFSSLNFLHLHQLLSYLKPLLCVIFSTVILLYVHPLFRCAATCKIIRKRLLKKTIWGPAGPGCTVSASSVIFFLTQCFSGGKQRKPKSGQNRLLPEQSFQGRKMPPKQALYIYIYIYIKYVYIQNNIHTCMCAYAYIHAYLL
jgi:hypothetical protein